MHGNYKIEIAKKYHFDIVIEDEQQMTESI